MASLWNDIDTALSSLIATATGAPVVVADQIDPDNVELPITLVRGNEAGYASVDLPMMGYDAGIDGVRYPYEVIYICANEDRAATKTAAADAARTLRNMLLANPQLGITTPSVADESIYTVELSNIELYVRGRHGVNQDGKYLGAAALAFDVVTTVTVTTS